MYKVLLALRTALFYVGIILVTLVMAVFFFLLFPILPQRIRDLYASSWCGFILFWLKVCCGVKCQLSGIENIPDKPVVIVSNHQSAWETLFLYRYLFPLSPILKKELFAIPVFGWALRLQKPIAIDRSKRREAGKSLLLQGTARLSDGYSVVVFPEGTRSKPNTVKRFSRGGAKLAIAADADILPVVHNAGHCWPPHQLTKYPGTVSVVIGKTVSCQDLSATELTEQLENWTREQLPVIEQLSSK